MKWLLSAAFAWSFAVGVVPAALAQVPAPPPADPGPPLSGYPRKALREPTPAELKTATYVRDVIYGHRDGMALTYDVFRPVKKANGALVVNMVSAGWRSQWAPPEERQALVPPSTLVTSTPRCARKFATCQERAPLSQIT